MALMLLLNHNGNNNNSVKSIESYGIISDDIATQLLEIVVTNKIKIFNKKEYFNLSDQEMLDVYEDEHCK